jgi:hypothetical protein
VPVRRGCIVGVGVPDALHWPFNPSDRRERPDSRLSSVRMAPPDGNTGLPMKTNCGRLLNDGSPALVKLRR